MRSMLDQTSNGVKLVCKKCKAENFYFTFTDDDDDLIIKCMCCTNIYLITRKI